MTPREFTDQAAQVRVALEVGEVIEVTVGAHDRPIGLLFVSLDLARVNASAERILPELGVGADWALVWSTRTSRGAPFRLLELGEHDTVRWSQVALELDLFSDDAKVVAAFLAEIGRIAHDVENLGELLAGVPVAV